MGKARAHRRRNRKSYLQTLNGNDDDADADDGCCDSYAKDNGWMDVLSSSVPDLICSICKTPLVPNFASLPHVALQRVLYVDEVGNKFVLFVVSTRQKIIIIPLNQRGFIAVTCVLGFV